jgi:hypothetical protein
MCYSKAHLLIGRIVAVGLNGIAYGWIPRNFVPHVKHLSSDCLTSLSFPLDYTVAKTCCLQAFVGKVGQEFPDQEQSHKITVLGGQSALDFLLSF